MKALKVIVLLITIILAGVCFYFGYTLSIASKPRVVFNNVIDAVDGNLYNYFKIENKYNLGDNFQIKGDFDFELDGTYYYQNQMVDPENLKIYNKITNLNNSVTTYNYIQNSDEEKLYKEINQKIKEEVILSKKVFVENTTEYVYISNVIDKYINNGTCVFFETLNKSYTTKDNINYLHDFIVNSLKNNLKDEYFDKQEVEVNLENRKVLAYQMSLRLDNKIIKNILNDIINDIKKDDRANNIISGVYKDFSKYKITDKNRFLGKDETYTINVYTDKILFKPLKYEVLHLDKNNRDVYSYEGSDKGRLYYFSNDEVKYIVDVSVNYKTYLFNILNPSGKEIGKIKLDKNVDMYNLDIDIDMDNKKYIIGFSSKIKNYKSKKSYNSINVLNIKYSENNLLKLTGTIKNNNNINTDNTIKEEVGDVIIRTALTKEQEDKYNNLKDFVTERFER